MADTPIQFKKFRIVDGMHMHGDQLLGRGDELVSGDDLVALHGKKFEFVENVPDPRVPVPATESKKAK